MGQKEQDVQLPKSISAYSTSMGGVDLSDNVLILLYFCEDQEVACLNFLPLH
jgi:hypothetical protein